MKRVFILSSHPLFGRGLENLLRWEEGLEIVGHVADPEQALAQIKTLRPDAVILDSSDPALDRSLVVMRIFREGLRPCVIGLDLRNNTLAIYRGEERIVESVRDLVDAIKD